MSEDFFVRFVSLFQAEADTLIAHADNLPHLVDPQIAPLPMVREMARWIGLPGVDEGHHDDHQRHVVVEAARALRWRGTVTGLRRIVRAHTGEEPQITEGGGVFAEGECPVDPAWVEIRLPGTGAIGIRSLVQIVRDEVPAHVRVTIWVDQTLVWPADNSEGEAS